ncbi:MAG: hypothetical protein CBC13_05570 [Planctomycetia bacterium TMED53]|nr:MAG: hypothetical protein CBC13_05570 [Planctomycetia bacterium TMED53]
MTEKIEAAGEPPQGGIPPRPVFKLLGCLTVLVLTIAVGLLIAMWMVTSGGLPREPLPLAPLEETGDPLNLTEVLEKERLQIQGSAAAWTQSIDALIQRSIVKEVMAPGSGFRCLTNPDGSLTLKVSLGIPETATNHSYLNRGRYINFTLSGEITIEDGSVKNSRIDEYSWGYIYNMQPGEVIEDASGRKIVERIIEQLVELGFLPSGLKTLRHDPQGITVELQ